jgi:hypothetical protein
VSLTTEQLERAIVRQDHDAIARQTRGMTEPQRAALADEAAALAELLILRGRTRRSGARYRRVEELDARLVRHFPTPPSKDELCREIPRGMGFAADVARYALCNEPDLPRTADLSNARAEVVVSVLVERRPRWLGGWLEKKLAAKVEDQVISWPLVRGLVRAGLAKTPLPDGYYQLLASPWTRGADGIRGPADLLRADAQLLEADVWQLFERDTRAFRRDQYWSSRWDWGGALIELAGERAIDRGRLLDATVRALAAKFQAATHRGLLALHTAIDPTPDERATRTRLYAALADHPVAKVRTLAVPKPKGAANKARANKPRTVGPG